MMERCLICNAGESAVESLDGGLKLIACRSCGRYEVNEEEHLDGVIEGDYQKHLAAHFLRTRERASAVYRFASRAPSGFTPGVVEWSVSRKINETLLYIADRSEQFGANVDVRLGDDWPLVQARGIDEFQSLLGHWIREGALKEKTVRLANSAVLALTGGAWKHIEEIRPFTGGGDGNHAFVAMAFDQDSLRGVYDQGIASALVETGWQPDAVEEDHFSEAINDRIMAGIRRASLVIADLTFHRPNVYFELGVARGLGIEVIITCRRDHSKSVHFDVGQYQHYKWDRADDLGTMLRTAIEARGLVRDTRR